ncbi:hypothetical protein BHM03_00009793 [Ensete ventricosum]|uniref:Uncharacterized protein n=1 Tax=Ensete ventricosum TaxID=4639 RepID=A0A445MCV1_ENSVE|nr:hypothetical protein BHM03_00009793 [Ensete ventricosum]
MDYCRREHGVGVRDGQEDGDQSSLLLDCICSHSRDDDDHPQDDPRWHPWCRWYYFFFFFFLIAVSLDEDHDLGLLQGSQRRHGKHQLSPGMPSVSTTQFAWNCAGNAEGQKIIFQLVVDNDRLLELAELIICNTVREMESPVFALFPNILPVGPLLSGQRLDHNPLGHFWPEDTTCVKWLDEQPANSVIYVAFGSFTVFDHRQLQELALGLELSRRPFLWVVRPDLASETSVAWLDSFRERTAGRGKMRRKSDHEMASELFYLCFRPWQRGHATFYGDMSGHETVRKRSLWPRVRPGNDGAELGPLQRWPHLAAHALRFEVHRRPEVVRSGECHRHRLSLPRPLCARLDFSPDAAEGVAPLGGGLRKHRGLCRCAC